MRRFCLLALCLWFLLVIPLQAQEEVQVYLPIISKGNCMGLATLAISDGTTEISLLNLAKIHLREDDGWTPRIIQAKGGGVFQDSSLAEGRRLVYRQFGTAREQFNFEIMGASQDGLIANTAELLQLLEKAVNYWDTDWQNTPVYLIAQSDCETYARYALILDYSASELQNPYTQPFIQQDGAIFDDITVMIERGHWLATIPGTATRATILSQEDYDGRTLGQESTLTNEVYLGNKSNVANLSDVYIDDGGVFSANLMDAALPFLLYPAAPALDDALYLGIDTTLADSGPFCSLVFDIGTGATYGGINGTTWEYWNGAWVALSVRDNTAGAGGAFENTGVVSVHFEQPSDWATVAINGITAYWVRCRLSNIGTPMTTTPTQQNRDIYSAVVPYVEVPSTVIVGDIPALAQIQATNQSGEANAAELYVDRMIFGLRTYDRGNSFVAFLNASDEQNSWGTATVGTNTSFASDVTTPTGRKATYNPGAIDNFESRAIFTFTTSADFYGLYRAFLRARQVGGNFGDIEVRLTIRTGLGASFWATEPRSVRPNDWSLVDLGLCRFPPDVISLESDETTATFRIEARNNVGAAIPDLDIYDLVLIPTDEWGGDFYNTEFENFDAGRLTQSRYLDVDSITFPKYDTRSPIRNVINEIEILYRAVNNGSAILQANSQQRLWVLGAKYYESTGTHTGANNASILTDAAADFINEGVTVGMIVRNTTDGSEATITGVTANTITGTLLGGTDDDWDNGDAYIIITDKWVSLPEVGHSLAILGEDRYLGMRGSG